MLFRGRWRGLRCWGAAVLFEDGRGLGFILARWGGGDGELRGRLWRVGRVELAEVEEAVVGRLKRC